MPSEREIFSEIIGYQQRLDEDSFIHGLLAFGLLHYYKLDRVLAWEEDREDMLMPAEKVQELADGFTQRQITDFYGTSIRALREYTARRSHQGPAKTHNTSYWYGVGQGLVSAFLYSTILLVIFLVTKLFGGDLLALLREILR